MGKLPRGRACLRGGMYSFKEGRRGETASRVGASLLSAIKAKNAAGPGASRAAARRPTAHGCCDGRPAATLGYLP